MAIREGVNLLPVPTEVDKKLEAENLFLNQIIAANPPRLTDDLVNQIRNGHASEVVISAMLDIKGIKIPNALPGVFDAIKFNPQGSPQFHLSSVLYGLYRVVKPKDGMIRFSLSDKPGFTRTIKGMDAKYWIALEPVREKNSLNQYILFYCGPRS